MYCKKCGFLNEKNSNFYSNCGSKLIDDSCDNNEVNKRKNAIINKFNEAKKLFDMKMYQPSLNSARLTLELLVKYLCKLNNITTSDYDKTITLEQMISALSENNIVSDNNIDLLHKVRILGNKGSHNVDDSVNDYEAKNAIDLLENLISNVINLNMNNHDTENQNNNIPMKNPDYYSLNRPFYGMWSNCMSIEELRVIPEYCLLESKANNGDINAMLDIATGFLPKREPIFFSENSLVCMPKYHYKGKEYYNKNAYDARYFYWIYRACDCACDCFENDRDFPKKYISTALLELIKYLLYTINYAYFCVNYVDSKTGKKSYFNQYSIYDFSTLKYKILDFTFLLMIMLDENDYDFSVFAPVHKETNFSQIEYIIYCYLVGLNILNPNIAQKKLSDYVSGECLAIEDEDANIPISFCLLEKYLNDDLNRKNYEFLFTSFKDKLPNVMFAKKENLNGLNRLSLDNVDIYFLANWIKQNNGRMEILSIDGELMEPISVNDFDLQNFGVWKIKDLCIFYYVKPNTNKHYKFEYKINRNVIDELAYKSVNEYINSVVSNNNVLIDLWKEARLPFGIASRYLNYCRMVVFEY